MKKIVIAGLGIMGKNHYNTLKNIDNVKIVGLCDIVKDTEYKEPFFTDVDKMLDETKPDRKSVV